MADEDRACAEIHEGIKRLEGQLQDATTEIQNGINQLKSEIQEARERMDRDLEEQLRKLVDEYLRRTEVPVNRLPQK